MNYHILLKDGKDWAVEQMDFTPLSTEAHLHYMKKAIDNAVPFKGYPFVIAVWIAGLEENKPYPCPDGYRIEIEGKHAILKPVN